MKLVSQASINKGAKIEYQFDTGHTLSVSTDGHKYITLGNRSAYYTHQKNIYKKMLLAIQQF
jgi:hypothetical protein